MLLMPLTVTLWLAGVSVREREATYLAVAGHPITMILAVSVLIGLLSGLIGWNRSYFRAGFSYTAIICIVLVLFVIQSDGDSRLSKSALQPQALLGIAFAASFFGSTFLLVRYFVGWWNRSTIDAKSND
jgi:formate hydrogenlyase subunit 3/multisubunit Na+/H+ antiporter MnhD subunit